MYQPDQNNFSDYQVVPNSNDLLKNSATLNFSFDDSLNDQNYTGVDCSNSTCNILASTIVLEGQAGDVINVSATYSSETYIQSQNFMIKLRECVVGEINDTINYECDLCESNTYSLSLDDFKCQECPPGAIYRGGSDISIQEKYYRSTVNDSVLLVLPCNDNGAGCKGGPNQTTCSESYSGVLCLQCRFQDGFIATGKAGECNKCYERLQLII